MILLVLASLSGSCRTSSASQVNRSIPVPSWISEPKVTQLPDGSTQLYFIAHESYPSSRVRDFYAQWAIDNGWRLLSREVDAWSTDSWSSFEAEDGLRQDLWTCHWRSSDGSKSLLMALRHHGDRDKQEVVVILAPYQVIDPPGDAETLGDYVEGR
jgi:hypothetical protein